MSAAYQASEREIIGRMITVVAEMFASPGCEVELKIELLAMVDATRKEEGCIRYDLYVSDNDPGNFVFYENWTSHEALDRHAASPHLKVFGAKAPVLLRQPARVATYTRIA